MLPFHIASVVFSFGILLYADHFAFAWMTGRKQTLDRKTMHFLHRCMWAGLISTMFFGVLLAYPMLSFLLSYPLFVMKMFFVGILLTNAFIIGLLMDVATTRPFASLSSQEKVPLFVSGVVSTIGWVTAATLGYFLF